MKKLLFCITAAIMLVACSSPEDKAKDMVMDYANALIAKDAASIHRLYPEGGFITEKSNMFDVSLLSNLKIEDVAIRNYDEGETYYDITSVCGDKTIEWTIECENDEWKIVNTNGLYISDFTKLEKEYGIEIDFEDGFNAPVDPDVLRSIEYALAENGLSGFRRFLNAVSKCDISTIVELYPSAEEYKDELPLGLHLKFDKCTMGQDDVYGNPALIFENETFEFEVSSSGKIITSRNFLPDNAE